MYVCAGMFVCTNTVKNAKNCDGVKLHYLHVKLLFFSTFVHFSDFFLTVYESAAALSCFGVLLTGSVRLVLRFSGV